MDLDAERCTEGGTHEWDKYERNDYPDGQWARSKCNKCGLVEREFGCSVRYESADGDAKCCPDGSEHDLEAVDEGCDEPIYDGEEDLRCTKCDATVTRTNTHHTTQYVDRDGNIILRE